MVHPSTIVSTNRRDDERKQNAMIAHQKKIWRFLKDFKNPGEVLTARQLAGLTGISEREVRATIAKLRRQGYPIASHPPYGFFIPRSANDAGECQAYLSSRLKDISVTESVLGQAFGRRTLISGKQMALPLFPEPGVQNMLIEPRNLSRPEVAAVLQDIKG